MISTGTKGKEDAKRLFHKVERSNTEVDLANLHESVIETINDDVICIATKIFEVLTLLAKGETFTAVGGVADLNGLEAWRRLVAKYSLTTPATALAAVILGMNPMQVKHVMELGKATEDWETHLTALEKDHGERLSNKMKAVVPSRLPGRNFRGCKPDGKI